LKSCNLSFKQFYDLPFVHETNGLYANERSFCRDYVSHSPKLKIVTILSYCKPPKVEHEYGPYQCVLEV
jgi:hypothetical protein